MGHVVAPTSIRIDYGIKWGLQFIGVKWLFYFWGCVGKQRMNQLEIEENKDEDGNP